MNAPPHDHGRAHGHPAADATGRVFLVAVALNLGFVAVEVAAGLYANSLALLADAGHNFGDVIGLVLSWVALVLARRRPSERLTYGLRGSTILAALGNAMLLLVAVGGIVWEAVCRLGEPVAVGGPTMIGVAAAGVLINGATALMLMRGRQADLNVRGAYLHMVADAGVSVGVVLAGVGMWWTGWAWLDPAIGLVIGLVILAGTWGLLKESVLLSLHAVPAGIAPGEVSAFLRGLPEVRDVHDLHVWGMSTTEVALTVHLVTPRGHPGDAFLDRLAGELAHRFGIAHATVQIELGDPEAVCRLAPRTVVSPADATRDVPHSPRQP
ncbi:cation diffusion facilitator family transporter [Urbifossiella limnaea]|uniref:Cadmium, cobalt and zinc/H(+)-K(+) antiporter n=1 Tax=Urbifossiella limnaea TaxID=2528023 RepID=A0A517XU11_9BACT|nr:cation diffusion facilitator family transporter [Urbifossiella limnaea]QDU20995.1 Cadmium, cobalt and zinc/H(+)-K(+) antiporter [Urbifossiella limnaea]